MEMPLYKCHKLVRALKLSYVVDRGCDSTTDENDVVDIYFEDSRFEPMMRVNLQGKPHPRGGWYFVQYEDYFSFSPGKAFEEGYSLIG
jgi:hypothetical protein